MVLDWVAWVAVFVWGLKGGLFGWEGGGLLDMPASKTTFRKQHLKDRGGLAEHLQLVVGVVRPAGLS